MDRCTGFHYIHHYVGVEENPFTTVLGSIPNLAVVGVTTSTAKYCSSSPPRLLCQCSLVLVLLALVLVLTIPHFPLPGTVTTSGFKHRHVHVMLIDWFVCLFVCLL